MSAPQGRGHSRTWWPWAALGVLVVVVVAALVLSQSSSTPPEGQQPPATTTEPDATTTPAPTTTTPSQPADCVDVQVILVPGTYETSADADPAVPQGLLAEVGNGIAERFPADRVSQLYVPYPAQFNNPTPYEESRRLGVVATTDAIAQTAARCPLTRFALTGFSQGASVAGDVATAIGNGTGPVPAEKVVGVALVSDPYRQPGQVQMPGQPVTGAGIGGPRAQGFGALTDRTATLCAPGDLICATPPDALAPQNLGATLAQLGTYLRSGVHSSYGSYVVTDDGTTGTQWVIGYLDGLIAPAVTG